MQRRRDPGDTHMVDTAHTAAGDPIVLDRVVVRFAGDSGDGMQLTGDRFTSVSRRVRQRPVDAARVPRRDPRPSRHRARRLQLPGAHLRPRDHHAWRRAQRARGDEPGGAARRPRPPRDRAARSSSTRTPSTSATCVKAGYHHASGAALNPLDDGSLDTLPRDPGADDRRSPRRPRRRSASSPATPSARRTSSPSAWCRGCTAGPPSRRSSGSRSASARTSSCAASNRAAFLAGFNFGETTEAVGHRFEVRPATLPAGEYTSITGNTALAWGIVAAGQLAKLPVTLGSLPDHAGLGHPPRAVEAQALRRAHGAGRGRDRRRRHGPRRRLRRPPRRHHHERPRPALKSETISLAISLELPLLDRRHPARRPLDRPADQDRGRRPQHRPVRPPRRGAAAGRRGVRARRTASTPRSRPLRIALKYRTPVILLSDGYLANGSEPWRCPTSTRCPTSRCPSPPRRTTPTPTATLEFWPYLRDPDTLARPWAIPGTPGLMHRIGGIEKEDGTGNINYTPENHQRWSTCAPPRSPASPTTSRR